MKTQFCIIGATRGTGLLITQQLLEGGSSVRVVARDPDKASRLLGNRADVRQGDVTDARSIRDFQRQAGERLYAARLIWRLDVARRPPRYVEIASHQNCT